MLSGIIESPVGKACYTVQAIDLSKILDYTAEHSELSSLKTIELSEETTC